MENIKKFIKRYIYKYFFFLSLLFFQIQIGLGQDDFGAPYSEADYGLLLTDRNYPMLHSKTDSMVVPCRRLQEKPIIFGTTNQAKDISGFVNKPFNELSAYEKNLIITKAWQTKDTGLLNLVLKIVLTGTSNVSDNNMVPGIICLSNFNSETVKKTLLNLLNSSEYGMYSALALVKLGLIDIGIAYIKEYYNEADNKTDINTALMVINTPEAIRLLMKISEDNDPSISIDALAALSLLGYCDFAFKGFCKYVTSNVPQVREKIAWCLAYYIGTPQAFDIIENDISIENGYYVAKAIEKIKKIYLLK